LSSILGVVEVLNHHGDGLIIQRRHVESEWIEGE